MDGSLGDYVLEAEVGHGAMGRVYRATHRPTGSMRAVKVISSRLDQETVLRFKREAEALARAGGDGVVPVHEVGSERGRLFLAMSFMPGGSLRDRIKAGPVPWKDAVKLGIELARALERCHAAGLVHRDLKPDNVLFDDQGRARIADFGLVRDLGSRSLTQQDQILGTPMYMAPELLAGERATAPSDVYALGVVLHELVTGRPPHLAGSISEVTQLKAKGTRPKLGKDAPPELDRILDRAIARKAQHRYPTATALRGDLEALLQGVDRSRGPLVALGVGAAVALVLVPLTIWAMRPRPLPSQAPLSPPAPIEPPVKVNTHRDTEAAARALTRVAESLESGVAPATVAAEVSRALSWRDPLPRSVLERILTQLRLRVDAARGTDAEEPVVEALQAIRLAKRFEIEIPLDRAYADHVLTWARRFRLAPDAEWRLEAVDAFLIAAREKKDIHYDRDVVRGACALLRVRPEVAVEARGAFDEAMRGFVANGLRTPLDLQLEFLASDGRLDEGLDLLRAVIVKGGELQDEEVDDAAIALFRSGWPPTARFRPALLDRVVEAAPACLQARALRAFTHRGSETEEDVAALEGMSELEDPDLQGADPERKIAAVVQAREREQAKDQLAGAVDRVSDPKRRARILVRLARTDEAAGVLERSGGDLAGLAPRVRAAASEADRIAVIKALQ